MDDCGTFTHSRDFRANSCIPFVITLVQLLRSTGFFSLQHTVLQRSRGFNFCSSNSLLNCTFVCCCLFCDPCGSNFLLCGLKYFISCGAVCFLIQTYQCSLQRFFTKFFFLRTIYGLNKKSSIMEALVYMKSKIHLPGYHCPGLFALSWSITSAW